MATYFVVIEVALQRSPADLQPAIAAALQPYGEPLRWAVTKINEAQQTAIVEAITLQAAA